MTHPNKYINLHKSGHKAQYISAIRNWDIAQVESIRSFMKLWKPELADTVCDALRQEITDVYNQYKEWRKGIN